ncbi:unnamed protein product [Didymodactylos carnosus]|uniref:F-box domain-containing protein n=1 Tax=Didymodactylos carnosus TaxID=1234261 RepID=A0A8S2QHZ3_9BILA|nr:unnamed protein product [Didymodactylos carnosus]CAF4112096.1 unnamed protein product [Didymodactylos carnosus]
MQTNRDIITKGIMSSKFEELPVEMMLEIFQYIDAYDLYHGFYDLIARLNLVINTADIKLHMIDYIHPEIFDYYCSNIISRFKHCLSYLRVPSDKLEKFLKLFNLNEFVSLRALILCEPKQLDDERMILEKLSKLKQLKYLSLNGDKYLIQLNTIDYSLISLQYLNIDCCKIKTFLFILQIIPNIKHIRCSLRLSVPHEQYESIGKYVPKLISLKFKSYYINFDTILLLLSNLLELKKLSFAAHSFDCYNGYKWSQLLSTLPLLKKFQFFIDATVAFEDSIDDVIQSWNILSQWNIQINYSNVFICVYTLPFSQLCWFTTCLYNMKTLTFGDQNKIMLNDNDNIQQLFIRLTNDHKILARYSNVQSVYFYFESNLPVSLPSTFLEDLSKTFQLSTVQSLGITYNRVENSITKESKR